MRNSQSVFLIAVGKRPEVLSFGLSAKAGITDKAFGSRKGFRKKPEKPQSFVCVDINVTFWDLLEEKKEKV